MTTYLSGVQPSGLQHLGNYFGAIRQHIAIQERADECYFFIADYHSLTTNRDPERLRNQVRETAVTYLSLGLDPERAVLFRQSDVPEVCELAWLLSTVTGMGLLERAHSYKDKVAHGIKPNVGLFTYPILMAADILAYGSDRVPVGKDQIQHVEMAQDMGGYFNNAYGEVFRRPEYEIPENESEARVLGLDGEKMSKSYGNDIWIFEEGKALKKRIGKIATDSRPPEEPKDPEEPGLAVLFHYFELLLPAAEVEQWKGRVRSGGEGAPGYGHLKQRLIEALDERFGPARQRRRELLENPDQLERILSAGAERARKRAQAVRDRALAACGLR